MGTIRCSSACLCLGLGRRRGLWPLTRSHCVLCPLLLQAAQKKARRAARAAKAAAIAPRPLDKLRPVVRCQTARYNRRVRAGRGFTLDELKAAGINRQLAKTIGIAVDARRTNRSVASMNANVERLKQYKAQLIVFPRGSYVDRVAASAPRPWLLTWHCLVLALCSATRSLVVATLPPSSPARLPRTPCPPCSRLPRPPMLSRPPTSPRPAPRCVDVLATHVSCSNVLLWWWLTSCAMPTLADWCLPHPAHRALQRPHGRHPRAQRAPCGRAGGDPRQQEEEEVNALHCAFPCRVSQSTRDWWLLLPCPWHPTSACCQLVGRVCFTHNYVRGRMPALLGACLLWAAAARLVAWAPACKQQQHNP